MCCSILLCTFDGRCYLIFEAVNFIHPSLRAFFERKFDSSVFAVRMCENRLTCRLLDVKWKNPEFRITICKIINLSATVTVNFIVIIIIA